MNAQTKTVQIGNKSFNIPSHMTAAGMAECWQGDSEELEAVVKNIVDNNKRFTWAIVSAYLKKTNQRLVEYKPLSAEEERLIKAEEERLSKLGVEFV